MLSQVVIRCTDGEYLHTPFVMFDSVQFVVVDYWFFFRSGGLAEWAAGFKKEAEGYEKEAEGLEEEVGGARGGGRGAQGGGRRPQREGRAAQRRGRAAHSGVGGPQRGGREARG